MKSKLLYEQNGQKTFVLVFDVGDEVISRITDFAAQNGLDAASLTAVGAFSDATLGYFDIEKKEYEQIPVQEQVEVLSMIGDIAVKGGDP